MTYKTAINELERLYERQVEARAKAEYRLATVLVNLRLVTDVWQIEDILNWSAEIKWLKRLDRVLKAMPNGVLLQVHGSFIAMVTPEAMAETFERDCDVDNVASIETISTSRVYPCSESL